MIRYCTIYQVYPVEEIYHYSVMSWQQDHMTTDDSPCIATQSLQVSSGGSLTADRRSTPECRDAYDTIACNYDTTVCNNDITVCNDLS